MESSARKSRPGAFHDLDRARTARQKPSMGGVLQLGAVPQGRHQSIDRLVALALQQHVMAMATLASRSPKLKAIAATEIAGAKKALLPDFVEPSLAYLVPEPPVGEEWLHEIKFDGYRLQARIEAGSVRLLTRSGQDWTPRFANVAQSLKKLKVNSALIDGEVVVQDDKGASSFAMLVDALKAGRSDRMVFFAFDVLYLDGRDLRAATLSKAAPRGSARNKPKNQSHLLQRSPHRGWCGDASTSLRDGP